MSAVLVWSVSLGGGDRRALAALLSAEEHERARRFAFDRDRDRFVAAHAALRAVLGLHLGVAPAAVMLAVQPGGRPVLGGDHPTAATFSLSHSGGQALIAVAAGRRVGVDIEHGPVRDHRSLASICFGPRERAALDRCPGAAREAAFLRTWTAKEAYLKGLGVGLSASLDQLDVLPADLQEAVIAADQTDELLAAGAPRSSWKVLPLGQAEAGGVAAVAAEGADWSVRPLVLDPAAIGSSDELRSTPDVV